MSRLILLVIAAVLVLGASAFAEGGIDYLALVNKLNPLPEGISTGNGGWPVPRKAAGSF